MRSGKTGASKTVVRALCLVLAILMMVLTCGAIIPHFVSAANYDPDLRVRVGLVYGDNVAPSFNVNTARGVEVGVIKNHRTYEPLMQFPNVYNTVALLEQSYTNLSSIYTPSDANVTVGNFHVQEDGSYTDAQSVAARVEELRSMGFSAYPAYLDYYYVVRIGAYATWEQANNVAVNAFTGKVLSIAAGRGDGVIIVDTDTGNPVFSCNGDSVRAGVCAIQSNTTSARVYCKTAAGSLFDGVLEFAKSGNGIRVVNLVDLDAYVLGVLPWEIYPTWPAETIKAFAVAMRTFAVYHHGSRHFSANEFDVCTTSHCQNYKGMSRSYQSMFAAVEDTSGEIATYNGRAIMSIYCGTNGGVTEDVRDIWGSSVYYPYLTSVTIPLEQESCKDQPNGVWTSEVSPAELSQYFVNTSGVSAVKVLTSPIAELNVLERSPHSGVYVYKLEIIDTAGNRAVVETSSSVRSALLKYCPSSYVDISYNYALYVYSPYGNLGGKMNSLTTTVLTANGEASLAESTPRTLTVLTAEGAKKLDVDDYTIYFDGKGNGHGGGMSMYGAVDLAKAGYDYKKILTTYYPNIQIESIGSPSGGSHGGGTSDDPEVKPGDFAGTFDKVMTTANLNLRLSPSSNGTVQCVVAAGTELVRIGIGGDGWDRVLSPQGFVCYVSKDYIVKVE